MKYNSTVVLMWNPAISSVTMEDYVEWFEGFCSFDENIFNWSVWDYTHVGFGDRFVLVRVGDDEHGGIVMDGMVSSDCYEDKDWAGTARRRHCVEMVTMKACNPERCAPYVTRAQLEEAIPDFVWSGGHSGQVLTASQAEALDALLRRASEEEKSELMDWSKIRTRDYLVDADLIHPSDRELKDFPSADPRPFIESIVKQSMGMPADRIETYLKKSYDWTARGHESLLRAAAWLAYPIRHELHYYGAMCMILASEHRGRRDHTMNAAYAAEAMSFLTDPLLRGRAVMRWLEESIRAYQNQGCGWAIDPLAIDQINGIDVLADFLGYDPLKAENMLHGLFVREITVDMEYCCADVVVSRTYQGDCETITFRFIDEVGVDGQIETEDVQIISEAHVTMQDDYKVQLVIDGCDTIVWGRSLEIIKK